MADQTFNFSWIPNGYGARLQRQAVLYPLLGGVKSPEDISKKTQQLLGMWRARLHALKEVGWYAGANNKDTQYARNCPPTFVYTTPHTRQCRIRHLCPFCYARWVLGVWQRLDETFPNPRDEVEVQRIATSSSAMVDEGMQEVHIAPGGDETGRRLRSIDLGGTHGSEPHVGEFPFHLLTRSVEKMTGFTRGREGETPTAFAGHLLSQLAHARAQTITKMNTLGAFAFTTLVPVETGWKIIHRELHIIRADYVAPEKMSGKFLRIDRPSRRKIFNTVARVCSYPCEMMYGDADMTKAALNARQGLRLSASYGVCRQNHRRL